MLVDWNEGYISVCPLPDLIPVEDKNTYLPSSTWGYIRGDISEQKDLMNLLTTIESGLSPAQIALLIDADERIDEVKADVILLEQKHNTEISDINTVLDTKVNITDVYTKSEIDSKNYLTEHQSLAGYATENWVKDQKYLTEHQSLAGLATEEWVVEQGYLTEHQSLAGYATENWVYNKGYISQETDPVWSAEKHKYALKSEIPSFSGYAKESWVGEQLVGKANINSVYSKTEIDGKKFITEGYLNEQLRGKVDTTDVYTKIEIDGKKYITESTLTQMLLGKANISDVYTKIEIDGKNYITGNKLSEQLQGKANLSDIYTKAEIDGKNYASKDWTTTELLAYAKASNVYTKDEVDKAIANVDVDLTGYATENWVKAQGYITEHQSLADYYTKSEVDTAISNVEVDLTGYATESYVDAAVESKVDYSKIWTGTQDEWDALSTEQQNSYIIAMIEIEL